jgi:hypothetical protein
MADTHYIYRPYLSRFILLECYKQDRGVYEKVFVLRRDAVCQRVDSS